MACAWLATDGENQVVQIRFPDPEFAESFRAYVNYFEDLAGTIGGTYGIAESLAVGVHDAVLAHPPVRKINRKPLTDARRSALERSLRKAWGQLRRAHREVEDSEVFDEESNALLPIMSHYSVYMAVTAYAIASNQQVPRDHAAALRVAGREVVQGLMPYPWSVSCAGCPQTGTHVLKGFFAESAPVHVLSRPDPDTSEDRLAMFLRTTRAKELERRFDDERRRRVEPGRSRRNVSRQEKEQIAASMPATTIFDVFWRMRKKASYDDADVFVLGAAGELDARRFAEALVIVTDATVAALEALIMANVGSHAIASMAHAYLGRTGEAPGSGLGRHVQSLRSRGTRSVVATA